MKTPDAPVNESVSHLGGSSLASTDRWDALPNIERMADEMDDPIAAIKLFSLAMVKTDAKSRRREFHGKVEEKLGELERLMRKYCPDIPRPRKSLLPWLRSKCTCLR